MTDDEVEGATMKIAHEYYNAVNVILDELPDMPKTQFMGILANSSALILARTLSMLNVADRDSIMHEIEKAALEMAEKSGGSLGYMARYDRLYPEEKNNDA